MAKRKSPKERKKERQQEQQRGQQMIIAGVVVVVVILGAIVFALTSLPAEAPIPDTLDRYDQFLTSTSSEGYAVLGNPNAPVTVREYSSYSCIGCLDFHSNVFPELLEVIADGRAKFEYVPLQTGSVPNAEGASRAAICAGQQGQYWQMHEVLFSWHEVYGNSAFQDGRIRTVVDTLGLDTGEFNRCFNSNETSTILNTAGQEGITSTPTITVNGVTVATDATAITEAIDSSNAGNGPFDPGVIGDTEETDAVEEVDTPEEEPEETSEAEATEEADDVTEPEATDDTEAVDEPEAEATEADDTTEEEE
ncbi:MAG: DsbA family protein [Anaerolineae bacterium]